MIRETNSFSAPASYFLDGKPDEKGEADIYVGLPLFYTGRFPAGRGMIFIMTHPACLHQKLQDMVKTAAVAFPSDESGNPDICLAA